MQRSKRLKLLSSAVLILSISVINFSQYLSGLQDQCQWRDLIIAWTWTNRGSIGTHLVFLLPIKKVFHLPMNPVDGPYDRCQHDRNVFKFTDWFWRNEFLLSIHFLNSPTLHVVQLEAPQSPYICTHLLTKASCRASSCSVFEKPVIPWLTCGRQLRLYWIFAYIFVISYLDMF